MVSFRLRQSEREALARLARLLGVCKTDAIRISILTQLERLGYREVSNGTNDKK